MQNCDGWYLDALVVASAFFFAAAICLAYQSSTCNQKHFSSSTTYRVCQRQCEKKNANHNNNLMNARVQILSAISERKNNNIKTPKKENEV